MDALNAKVISLIKNAKTLDESLDVLNKLLSNGFAVWEDGYLYEIKKLVDKVQGLKIEVYSNEHSPPHFHIKGRGVDAIFTIDECECLRGDISSRDVGLIEFWYRVGGREKVIAEWNATRPTGCPVGSFEEKII